ncbi:MULTISPECIES: hypothetical protein [Kitasatospora]|uniref:Uncharacterized protein n=1 Tax=Kitasatospora setae (strain ATCC 33774 / DSM 43861 / JCM 3304 / KCC A-0304 / NBRC 14216 / KM-6054) TaxID=452652 RepID=E4MYW8_KITSK|nr:MULTISPECIES: hypothetical protein [Kitasatospora]BAJ25861.1 hypothetical protein KSE_00080t [Kitasatospora setae KM-6054]BAJ33417.1 hypothetical protein KSE_76660t [Kitasatospora setae KM-6054]
MTAKTHRTRLAKALAKTRPVSYQKALAHVVACGDAGLLPARLDQDGMSQALAVLERHLDTPAVVESGPAARSAVGPAAVPSARKPPMSKDPRCVALSDALLPVLESTSPEGAGGYGGSLQANLSPAEAEALGGLPLIRAALRRAARRLGWRVQTVGHESEHVVVVFIHDTREAPAEFAEALERDRHRQGREAAERMDRFYDGRDVRELGPGPVDRQSALFRTAARAVLSRQA